MADLDGELGINGSQLGCEDPVLVVLSSAIEAGRLGDKEDPELIAIVDVVKEGAKTPVGAAGTLLELGLRAAASLTEDAASISLEQTNAENIGRATVLHEVQEIVASIPGGDGKLLRTIIAQRLEKLQITPPPHPDDIMHSRTHTSFTEHGKHFEAQELIDLLTQNGTRENDVLTPIVQHLRGILAGPVRPEGMRS